MGSIQTVLTFLRALLVGRAALAAENLALRNQLAALQRSVKRPKLRTRDRIFRVWLSRSGHLCSILVRPGEEPDTARPAATAARTPA